MSRTGTVRTVPGGHCDCYFEEPCQRILEMSGVGILMMKSPTLHY
jgi:hypothetical protein